MNTEKEVINFAAETLTGDIRDFLVDRLRNFPKVWAQMTEDEQELFDGDAEEKAAEEEPFDEKDFLGVDGDDGEAA